MSLAYPVMMNVILVVGDRDDHVGAGDAGLFEDPDLGAVVAHDALFASSSTTRSSARLALFDDEDVVAQAHEAAAGAEPTLPPPTIRTRTWPLSPLC